MVVVVVIAVVIFSVSRDIASTKLCAVDVGFGDAVFESTEVLEFFPLLVVSSALEGAVQMSFADWPWLRCADCIADTLLLSPILLSIVGAIACSRGPFDILSCPCCDDSLLLLLESSGPVVVPCPCNILVLNEIVQIRAELHPNKPRTSSCLKNRVPYHSARSCSRFEIFEDDVHTLRGVSRVRRVSY